jgi:hypothetical protein
VQAPDEHTNGQVAVVCHVPEESHVCEVVPEHCLEPGAQAPLQLPEPLQANGQAVAGPHFPLASQVSFELPTHFALPGAQVTQDPARQNGFVPEQAVESVQDPDAPHTRGTLPEQSFAPGVQTDPSSVVPSTAASPSAITSETTSCCASNVSGPSSPTSSVDASEATSAEAPSVLPSAGEESNAGASGLSFGAVSLVSPPQAETEAAATARTRSCLHIEASIRGDRRVLSLAMTSATAYNVS